MEEMNRIKLHTCPPELSVSSSINLVLINKPGRYEHAIANYNHAIIFQSVNI